MGDSTLVAETVALGRRIHRAAIFTEAMVLASERAAGDDRIAAERLIEALSFAQALSRGLLLLADKADRVADELQRPPQQEVDAIAKASLHRPRSGDSLRQPGLPEVLAEPVEAALRMLVLDRGILRERSAPEAAYRDAIDKGPLAAISGPLKLAADTTRALRTALDVDSRRAQESVHAAHATAEIGAHFGLSVQIDDPYRDPEELIELTRDLQRELEEHGIDVVPASYDEYALATPDAPEGVLLVVRAGRAVPAFVGALSAWLGRQPRTSIALDRDGERLIVSSSSAGDVDVLVAAWLARGGG